MGFPSERIEALATYPTTAAGKPKARIFKYWAAYIPVLSLPPKILTNHSNFHKTRTIRTNETINPKNIAVPKNLSASSFFFLPKFKEALVAEPRPINIEKPNTNITIGKTIPTPAIAICPTFSIFPI